MIACNRMQIDPHRVDCDGSQLAEGQKPQPHNEATLIARSK
jgi:hypothetical protein